eukprot:COSAG05_NODE_337_length_11164_cov_11.970357_7_plen_119_part_00
MKSFMSFNNCDLIQLPSKAVTCISGGSKTMSIMALFMALYVTSMKIVNPVQSYGALIGMMELNLIILYRICKTIACRTKMGPAWRRRWLLLLNLSLKLLSQIMNRRLPWQTYYTALSD